MEDDIFTIQNVIMACKREVPQEYKRRPYRHPELNNGVALLQSEDALNCYIAAYGEMHMVKCRAALQNFPFNELKNTIEIVDWGCGQGIGSLSTVEALEEHDKTMWLKRVTLIEPSPFALERAEKHLTRATNGTITIDPIERYLPQDTQNSIPNAIEGVEYKYKNIIHIFSNILDIININLFKLAKIIANTNHNHFVLCVGPMNVNANRIDQFCSIFGKQNFFSNISDKQYGRTSDTFYPFTCKTKCFQYNGNPLNTTVQISNPVRESYNEYDPLLAVENGIISDELKKIYLILLNQLNADDIILIKPDINGAKPDLVVVRPNKGILIVTLFEDDLNEFEFKNEYDTFIRTNDEKTILSPIKVADTFQQNLIRDHVNGMMEKVIAVSIIKTMVLCTKNITNEVREKFKFSGYTSIYGKDLLNNKDIYQTLLRNIKLDYNNKAFDKATFDRFLDIITPKWHSYRQGKQINLTKIQQNLSQSVANKKQKISGVAGSGKTQVLATRAVNAQVRTGGNVLILTYNKTLKNYLKQRLNEVRADFPWNKIHIDNYHNFFTTQAKKCNLPIQFNSYDDASFFMNDKKRLQKYDAIFVDEVQDYKTEWLQLLDNTFLIEDGEFVVFGDPKQNIYKRELDRNGDIRLGFIGGEWNKQLKEGKRFANPQLTELAVTFQQEFFKKIPADEIENSSEIKFSQLKYINAGYSFEDDITNIILDIIQTDSMDIHNTVILSQTKQVLIDIDRSYRQITNKSTKTTFIQQEHQNNDAIENQKKIHFTMDGDELKLSTIQSFKGWDAPNVILLLQSEERNYCYSVSEEFDSPEIIYTAITRAKENLFIINLGNQKYHSFFAQNMEKYPKN